MSDAVLLSAARGVQLELEAFYGLEAGPDVAEFVHAAEETTREALLVRSGAEELELALVLPDTAARGARSLDDAYLQLVEGVSHFVYVAERARIGLPATELELELQAEVDKFVLFAFEGSALLHHRAPEIRRTLYDRVTFLHAPESEHGKRYRLANALAARLSLRLLERRAMSGARRFLQRFYRSGQSDKIRIAQA